GIMASEFHRYPIALTSRDRALKVSLGFHPDSTGSLILCVYDADGHQVFEETVRRSPALPDSPKDLKETSNAETIIAVKKPGIYEITVANASGRWIGNSSYDL